MDVWELRCWFRHERILERLQAGELTENVTGSSIVKQGSPQPPGTLSQEVRYIDKASNKEVAKIHRYVLPNGSLGAGEEPDPKYIFVGGVRYTLFDGSDHIKRDPCNLFPVWWNGWLRRKYGDFRKLCCRLLGPRLDGRLAFEMTPILKRMCFWHTLLKA